MKSSRKTISASTTPVENRDPVTRRLNRKIALSQWALFFERMWPRLWVTMGAILAFLGLSFFNIWTQLPQMAHQGLLGVLAVVALGGLLFALRTPWPARDDALRTMETQSGLPHRPATTMEDHVSETADPMAKALWEAHQQRMAERADRIRPAAVHVRTHRYDPVAVRAAAILLVALGAGLAGAAIPDRLVAAFDFGRSAELAARTRLDAWITPPTYTARPPIILADGGSAAGESRLSVTPEAPEGSLVRVRVSGDDGGLLKIEARDASGQRVGESVDPNAKPEEGEAAAGADEASAPSDGGIREAVLTLKPGVTDLTVTLGGTAIASWPVTVIPDLAPTIRMTKEVERTRRGGMKLFYEVKDDFGLAGAEARFEALPPDEEDPRTQWARPDVLTGPRLPLERPPKIALRLPPRNSEDGQIWTFHELGSHPWAGMRVRMTLVAKDHAGNEGRSKPVDMKLPERLFRNPLARAVIEQRRNLVIDPRYANLVRKALAALTIEPEGFINDLGVYMGLRSVYHRLRQDQSRGGIASAVEQLWHIALRIEDGKGLSEAERRLRELQERLSQAIQNGASDEEIRQLMQELRQALAEFMQQLARQAEQNPQMQMPDGFNQQMQTMTQQDLDRMLQDLENMARQGSKDMAQEMLSQLRDLIDRLQSGRMARNGQQNQQSQQMMQMMDQFGNIIGQQQRLMDDTYGEQRQPGQQGQQGQRGQQGQQGQQGQRGQQGQMGQRGQQGQQGQQGQMGQNGRGQGQGQRPGQGPGQDSLAQRQGQLGRTLDQLRGQMRGMGMQEPGQLGGAQRSMNNAERALEQGDLDTATREQARALEQLRQGAQSMAQQMLQQMPSRYGRAGDAPLDPLGRPQRTDGPDLGSSVRVPEEIETQRAREILEELRRRLGQPQRPEIELEYIERLLERF